MIQSARPSHDLAVRDQLSALSTVEQVLGAMATSWEGNTGLASKSYAATPSVRS